jgi:hypothetical protein
MSKSISEINSKADFEDFFKYNGYKYTVKKEVINDKLVWNVYETKDDFRKRPKLVINKALSDKANQFIPLVDMSTWSNKQINYDRYGYPGAEGRDPNDRSGRGSRKSKKSKKSKKFKKSKKSKKSRR